MSKSCNVHSFSNTFVVVVVNDDDVVNETIKIIIGFSVRLRVLEHKHTRSACVFNAMDVEAYYHERERER